ncbi:peptide-methionine (S)-S-oxide reductase MsrA [Mycolicibacterium fluoranthenivorans]|uniref:Peptide methionine sulfoxide reductase MsrA n=1 Tax=Mycolicibacterium fluoranthenivorans TaxID=258505 RepID=A0A1G4WT21_9MYCO|nr:peptide-methionine (S)-S-oxide reductase MsrA [Mycolicibacterium fluoranthenivorans]SCX28145.1 peptide-methionine (S)-S-oxide reductase [Mycolicibacterium fluoranthenivorans]
MGRSRVLAVLVGALCVFTTACTGLTPSAVGTAPPDVPKVTVDQTAAADTAATAVLAGGCFWGMQGVFEHVKGVNRVLAGYTGGDAQTAHYDEVSADDTGHAESVQITYDPHQITYGTLLQIFFSVAHDPTEVNRQGPDSGTQYRSAIFPQDDDQARIAAAYIAQLGASQVFSAPVATTVEAGRTFYPAEDYHQDYMAANPTDSYISVNDMPKLAQLKRRYPELYHEQPVLVKG